MALKVEQGLFHRQAPGIASQAAVRADDAVARHDDAQGIRPDSAADSMVGAGPPDGLGQLLVVVVSP